MLGNRQDLSPSLVSLSFLVLNHTVGSSGSDRHN